MKINEPPSKHLSKSPDSFPRGVAGRCRRAIPDSRDSFDGKFAGKDDPYFVALMLYRELVSSSTGHHAAFAASGLAKGDEERAAQCKLLRCIVGTPPFGTNADTLEWRKQEVVTLAEQIFETKSFDLLPSLASELEQSGCDDEEMLRHCHSSDPHVRGCWVIDAILGFQ